MPIQSCSENGKPGYRYGKSGKCYTYKKGDRKSMTQAKRKAFNQGYAEYKGGSGEKPAWRSS